MGQRFAVRLSCVALLVSIWRPNEYRPVASGQQRAATARTYIFNNRCSRPLLWSAIIDRTSRKPPIASDVINLLACAAQKVKLVRAVTVRCRPLPVVVVVVVTSNASKNSSMKNARLASDGAARACVLG